MTPQISEPSAAPKPSAWMRFKAGFIKLFSGLPILGPLTNCTAKNHRDTLKEFFITILFGTATFWVTALFLKAFSVNDGKKYTEILISTVSTGQLFIFAVGMLGPILLSSAEDPDSTKQFPGRTYHFALILLLGALASGFYAFVLAGREPQASGLLNSDFLFTASVSIAAVVVVMRYLTTVYRKSTASFDAEQNLKEPVDEFARKFNARHSADSTLDIHEQTTSAADEMAERLNQRNGGAR
ncbi:hypothetical protein I5U31_03975 [Stenotrophomonas maltophilia]|nr:hypothetical protein [Stenotrophomonas maltophilia]HDS1566379.1 hypothetical protein [Stenotrophomonas maltophilia]HEL5400958.1 hypothetical protein [Stenotrophomonas maltophilia]